MRVDILTVFPDHFDAFLTHGMVDQARRKGILEVRVTDLRSFTEDRHRSVDGPLGPRNYYPGESPAGE